MNFPPKTQRPRAGVHGAFILVAVLVLVMLLSMLVISLLFRFKAEDTAASASVGTEQAWAAALSGVEEALRVASSTLPGATDWQQNPGAFHERLMFEDGADRWYFTVFSPGDEEGLGETRYGLTDEASKLNVNALADANLEKLPRLSPAMAAALRDYEDADSTPLPEGAEQDYYNALPRPYAIRNGPLASLDELLLVRGFTPALLHGTPAAATGPDDTSPAGAFESRGERGLSRFLTIASYELNTSNDGETRMNFNDAAAALPTVDLPPDLLNFIAALQTNRLFFAHPADLLEATLTVKDGKGVETELSSGVGKDGLSLVLDQLTASDEERITGLVNVNTASLAALAALPGSDDTLAETIVSSRRSISPERRTTIAWLFQEGVLDAEKFKLLAPRLTARSYQFSFQVIGYGLPSGRFRVLEAGLDVAGGARRVTYLRDVTRRGLPFPLGGETERGSGASSKRMGKEVHRG